VSDKVLRKATGPRDFSRAIARIDKMQSTSYDLSATDISQNEVRLPQALGPDRAPDAALLACPRRHEN
jgi:hypothetical protein